MKTLISVCLLLFTLVLVAQTPTVGRKVSDYPNNPNMQSNFLFLVAAPSVPTNYNISFGQLQFQFTGSFTGAVAVITNVYITNLTAESSTFVTNVTFIQFVTNQYVQQDYVSNLFVTNITVTGQGNGPWILAEQGVGDNTTITNLTVINDFTFNTVDPLQAPILDLASNGVTLASFDGASWLGNGINLTNLHYAYTTNVIPNTGSLSFGGLSYKTNIQANITLGNFAAVNNAVYESIVLFVTNSTASDHSITFPNGVTGSPGSGTPPVYWCTNKLMTKILIEHYGQDNTNAIKQDYAP